ncbi:MAG: citrate lyase acyl carrier protein [Oscillospiraceae bacterium]|nr:citrate lyase acyl carrier protein [Oscillospiraceae bacterium]
MKKIVKEASAGTVESSDVLVHIAPNESGIELDVESVVLFQFGEAIRAAVLDTLREQGVENAKVRVMDRGALDCVIRARVETAVMRAEEVAE